MLAGAAFDPLGDGDEHSDIVPLALDGDPSTAWSSEDYRALNKAGLGFVVDAKRPVSPTRLTLKIPTPGFALAVYGATNAHAAVARRVDQAGREGWREAQPERCARRERRSLPPPPPLGHLPPAGAAAP